jgi:hypothetical protein
MVFVRSLEPSTGGFLSDFWLDTIEGFGRKKGFGGIKKDV